MGYSGGKKDAPTYRSIGDHTETVQIDYDPDKISYERLLEIFWLRHNPAKNSFSRQYRNVIFFHSQAQKEAALKSEQAVAEKLGKTVKTDIEPFHTFTLAEDYHQKYLLSNHPLNREIKRIYTRTEDIVNSTAAARLNGYAGHNGTKAQMEREIDLLGLSPGGKTLLKKMFAP